jgi:drug/metabolite transporter (DMT)-like permease
MILLVSGVIKLGKKPYWKLFALILFQPVLYFIFETYGVQRINSSEAGMIIALIPVVVNVLAAFMLKEKGDLFHYILVGAGFLGVVLIIGFDLSKGTLLGKIFMFFAVLSGALYSIYSRKFSKQFSPEEITFFMMMTGAIFFTLMSIMKGEFEIQFNIQTISSGIYLGILSSAGAFFLLNYMINKASPIVTTLFSNLTTVISVIAGIAFRNEMVGLQQILGMLLIISSLLVTTIRRQKVSPSG